MIALSPPQGIVTWIRSVPWLTVAPILVVFGLLVVFSGWQYQLNQQLQSQANSLQQDQAASLEEVGYIRMQQVTEQEKMRQLESALLEATSSATLEQQQTINSLYDQYADVKAKLDRNSQAKLDISSVEAKLAEWGTQLLKKEFDALVANLAGAQKSLDEQWSSYQASLAVKSKPAAPSNQAPSSSSNLAGYSNTMVNTSRGAFSTKLIKLPLSQVQIKTVSASSTNCTNNCPTKTLAQYVQEHGGFAGINGSYFCPPDYSWCSGKTSSFDFALYNTASGSWINQNALGWTSIGLATFNGSTAQFYKTASQFGGGSVTAAISNFPTLLVYQNSVAISDNDLDSAQKNKGVRGALGVGGGNIYLAIISGASVTDAAYVMHALGTTDALNLDGGGSAALYIDGSYKAGPGRLLPNAIVLTR